MTTNKTLPPLSEWTTYHASQVGRGDKYGSTIKRDGVQWDIEPVQSSTGRFLGYRLWAFGLPGERGYVFFYSDGRKNYIGGGTHARKSSASVIARKVHESYFGRK